MQNNEVVFFVYRGKRFLKKEAKRNSKRLKLSFLPSGEWCFFYPKALKSRWSLKRLEHFIDTHWEWILKIEDKEKQRICIGPFSEEERQKLTILCERAVQLFLDEDLPIKERPNRITIRNQKTRWGSLSSKGTLSINFRAILLPAEYFAYIILHELCHLTEMNHSERFYKKLYEAYPKAPEIEKNLKNYRIL